MDVNVLDQEAGAAWALYHGDCVEVLSALPENSIHFTIFSPPFASLYTFSDDPRDLSNCKDDRVFWAHYAFVCAELMRVTRPGRLVSIHCMNLPTSKNRDGFIGLRDFRGEIIRAHEKAGMIYHSEVCIRKDPVVAMQRSKSIGLLHKQVVKDSALSRMSVADYVVTMRKPGENAEPISGGFDHYYGTDGAMPAADPGHAAGHIASSYSVKVWQRYAEPVWMDIAQSDVLSRMEARDVEDERHIAPLQLTVIRRCVDLWSNQGDVVLSPFAGIGSEGYVALELGRRFVGIELKRSYFDQARENLARAEEKKRTGTLFDAGETRRLDHVGE
jgi:hypothetical protein